MFVDFAANQCLALQRSATYRKVNTSNSTFRSAGAKNLLERTVYKHSVPTGLSDLVGNLAEKQELASQSHGGFAE